VAVERGTYEGRHNSARGGRGGRVPLPNKYIACGGMDHILSFRSTSDDALLS
jgi:hypothetical protein